MAHSGTKPRPTPQSNFSPKAVKNGVESAGMKTMSEGPVIRLIASDGRSLQLEWVPSRWSGSLWIGENRGFEAQIRFDRFCSRSEAG